METAKDVPIRSACNNCDVGLVLDFVEEALFGERIKTTVENDVSADFVRPRSKLADVHAERKSVCLFGL